ncbi:UDP-glucose 4-epimerase, partial [bacterium]|nr:UDP-glucose 4-epimerase [bacterium]
KHAYSENSKVKKVFKYKPACGIEEGLKRMAKWALKIGVKKSKQFKNIEIEKNLPPSWKN